MANVICKGSHFLGKLSRNETRTAPRNCAAFLTWELRQDGDKIEFSACGEVWNHLRTDVFHAGQCVAELAAKFPRDKLAQRIKEVHALYHLNGMKAGTAEQTRALEIAEAEAIEKLRNDPNAPRGCFYDDYPAPGPRTKLNFYVAGDYLTGEKGAGHYGWACAALKAAGLYDVPITSDMRCTGGFEEGATMYRYGSRWLHDTIPADVLEEVQAWRGRVEGQKFDAFAAVGLSITSEFVPFSKSRNKKEKHASLNWRVTVLKDGREVLTCDYSAGSAHCPAYNNGKLKKSMGSAGHHAAIVAECEGGRAVVRGMWAGSQNFVYGDAIKPEARDVFRSLFLDAEVFNASSFADWCAEMGGDADSIKDRAAYDQCLAVAVALRGALGPRLFDEMQEGNR